VLIHQDSEWTNLIDLPCGRNLMIDIIGGSGFIGTRLAARLERNGAGFRLLDIVGSARFPEQHRQVDVRDIKALRDHITGPNLINLAAEHRDDVRPVSRYHDVNVQGARNVCTVASEKLIDKIIFTSTVAVYGLAPRGTNEHGGINPFNEYGRTKYAAESIYRNWQEQDPERRALVIIRPTVVFGERNRGNVYNLLRHIARGKFVMIGSGQNVKSMAYVENVAAFLEHTLSLGPGIHVYNYIDKPDLDMNTLVATVRKELGRDPQIGFRLPYALGLLAGYFFDVVAWGTRRSLPVSSVRIRKFCADTQFATSISETGFDPPVALKEALQKTVVYEFLEDHRGEPRFFSE
jgi:GlcNAc-P-P-Und epimerase